MRENRFETSRRSVFQQFMAKVFIDAGSGCWIWNGGRNGRGDPVFWKNGTKAVLAHRFAYRMFEDYGLGSEFCIIHSCGEKRCVNYRHMKVVKRAEISREAYQKSLEKSVTRKLIADSIIEIRQKRNNGYTLTSLAREYGVSVSHISRIARKLRCKVEDKLNESDFIDASFTQDAVDVAWELGHECQFYY